MSLCLRLGPNKQVVSFFGKNETMAIIHDSFLRMMRSIILH